MKAKYKDKSGREIELEGTPEELERFLREPPKYDPPMPKELFPPNPFGPVVNPPNFIGPGVVDVRPWWEALPQEAKTGLPKIVWVGTPQNTGDKTY